MHRFCTHNLSTSVSVSVNFICLQKCLWNAWYTKMKSWKLQYSTRNSSKGDEAVFMCIAVQGVTNHLNCRCHAPGQQHRSVAMLFDSISISNSRLTNLWHTYTHFYTPSAATLPCIMRHDLSICIIWGVTGICRTGQWRTGMKMMKWTTVVIIIIIMSITNIITGRTPHTVNVC